MKTNRLVKLLMHLRGNPEGAKAAIKQFLGQVHELMPMEFEGNFMATRGTDPRIIFTAHYDTVDPIDLVGTKNVVFRNMERTILGLSHTDTSGATCLGADDGAGCEILACLYEAGVPGIYIWSAEEERGCLGTRRLLKQFPEILDNIDHVVSFDRRGFNEIITHQLGHRTCSQAFANALGGYLNMHPSDNGCYTDSNEYANDIPECTNVACGYLGAHTKGETLNLTFLRELIDDLKNVPWATLPVERDPWAHEEEHMDSEDICYQDPALVHRFLMDMGLTKELEDYARWAYGEETPKGKDKEIKLWNPDNDPSDPFYSSYVYP